MINLEEHKIFVESLNMEVIPYSVAVKAVQEVSDPDTTKYFNELETAINELKNKVKDVDLDD